MHFIQKSNWLGSRHFIIEQEGLRVISSSFAGANSKYYDFHEIGNMILRKKTRNWLALAFSLLFFLYGSLALAEVLDERQSVSLGVGLIMLGFVILPFFFFTSRYLYIKSEQYDIKIKFLDNIPSERELMAFIDNIKKAQRIRFQRLYLTIDENMSYQDYRNNIEWLRDNDFLTHSEAEQRLGETENPTFDSPEDLTLQA